MFWVKNIFNKHDKNQNYLKIDSNNYLLFSFYNSFPDYDNNKINKYLYNEYINLLSLNSLININNKDKLCYF